MDRFRPTLGQVFLLTILGLTALLGALFYVVLEGSREAILEGARRRGEEVGKRIGERVEGHLDQAQKSVENIERQIRHGACQADDALSLESTLFAEVLNNPYLAEVTLTHAEKVGFGPGGAMLVGPQGRWQVSVFRHLEGEASRIVTHFRYREGGRFVVKVRDRPAGGALLDAPLTPVRGGGVEDPTEHLTFSTTASHRFYGRAIWTDLHFTELDQHLPKERQRVVVSVMKAVEDREGRFAGVLRVGLLTEQVDELVRDEAEANAPHRIFICDNEGRLISRPTPADRLNEQPDESLRVAAERVPAEIASALAHPALASVGPDALLQSGELAAGGHRYLLTFKGLPRTQGWRVGILGPEDYYLEGLRRTRDRLLASSLVVMALILAGGGLTLRVVQRGLARIVDVTARMRHFDFAPSEVRSPFRDVRDVMDRLEVAKTAMRAMGRYVPVDLVRLLYQTGREPVLGGELAEVSLMFTDIKDFTTLAERLAPNELARVLGRYLETMTAAIHAELGTIDKYIGDAIMAVWNTPTPCPGHARRACAAALACVEAAERLFSSEEWAGSPRLVTRFGLHRDEVLVGHFGAPDRMSFTCLGDGVNLASRLEGLNKQYGTTAIASEAIRADAGGEYEFRRLDRVAVKGKSRGIEIYELLGRAGAVAPALLDRARRYEEALAAYFARDFGRALEALGGLNADPPSAGLAERCRRLAKEPPPPDWDGIYVATAK